MKDIFLTYTCSVWLRKARAGAQFQFGESYRRVTTERMTEICREVFRQSNILLTVKGKKKKVDTERLAEILRDALSCR